MPFGIVSGVSRGIGVLDEGGDRRKGKGSFGGEFETYSCARVMCYSQITLGGLVSTGQIIKTKLGSVSLYCISHHYKTAKIK